MNPPKSKSRPVILHLLHTLRPAGAENLVRQLVEVHREQFDFAIAALDEAGPLQQVFESMSIPVHVLGRRPGIDHRCASAILALARRHAVDIIHAHQYTPFFYTALARCTGMLPSRVLFTEHGRHYPDVRRLPRRVINRLVLHRMADRVTAVGAFVKQALVASDGIPAERVEVIHNGIDAPRFAPPAPFDRATARAALSLSTDDPVILHVAGFRPVKDHLTALDALQKLHALGSPAHLLFAGAGPTLPLIRQEAHERGLTAHAHFLGARGDIASLWHLADLGLLTSLSEGVSVAMLEGMAAGKAFVATNVGGNPEVLVHGNTGLLAPRGDANTIASALHELLTDPARRHVMGRAAAHRVTAHFSQQRMHAEYLRIYGELVASAWLAGDTRLQGERDVA